MATSTCGTIRTAALVVALAAAAPVAAQTTASMNVTATVVSNCSITTVQHLVFGNYDPLGVNALAAPGVPLLGQGQFSVACPEGTAYSISLSLGSNPAGATRQMAGGADRLVYEIFSDSNRTQLWDNAVPNTVGATSTSLVPVVFTAYGRIPGGQDVPIGAYSDVVVATVNF